MGSRRLIPTFAVTLALAACYPAAEAPALSDEDTAAIQSLLDNYVANVQAQDWTTLLSYYVDGAVRMPPDAPMQANDAEMMAWLEALPPVTSFSLTPHVIDGRGDLAYARGAYTLDLAPPDAPPVQTVGKWHAIYERQADGSWLCVSDIWNSDVPPAM